MSEIADFLRARLAERRALAVAAAEDASAHWSPGDEHLGSSVNEAESGAAVVIGPWEHLDWDVRRHIAANDPAAVIADCDAKLWIVNAAEKLPELTEAFDQFDNNRDAWARTLKLLAQPYARHDDHKGEEWAP